MDWNKKNEEHLSEMAGDKELNDPAYCEALEDLIDRAQSALDAKRAEMDIVDDEVPGEGSSDIVDDEVPGEGQGDE